MFILFFIFHFLVPLKSGNNIIDNQYTIDENDDVREAEYFGELVEELGVYENQISNTEIIYLKFELYRKTLTKRTQKSFSENKEFGYSVIATSESYYRNQLTSTWLFGLMVTINTVPVTKALHPRGLDIMIYTTPTKIFYFEENRANVDININWESSAPDPKIIK